MREKKPTAINVEEDLFSNVVEVGILDAQPDTSVGANWLQVVRLALDERFAVGPNGEITSRDDAPDWF